MIDASRRYRKLHENPGNKNCEFAPEHIREIMDVYERMLAVYPDQWQFLTTIQKARVATLDDQLKATAFSCM